MNAIEFEPWPKIARLNRDIVVTEKIDGTNAAVVITAAPYGLGAGELTEDGVFEVQEWDEGGHGWMIGAQSRTRFISPENDNYGFAKWVRANAEALVNTLGEGRHFGEWWGQKIQRGYGMDHKVFSLFNTFRWNREEVLASGIDGLDVVPTLYKGLFSEFAINRALDDLREDGSLAAYHRGVLSNPEAEGVVVFHTAANSAFKVTLKGDEAPKGAAGHALDTEK